MKLKSIYISNIGSHKETNIGFEDMSNIIAITGQNGTGKTFLIESIPAALYGTFPSRVGSIYDKMSKGFAGIAEIKLFFDMNDKSYLVERTLKKTNKTTSSEASLFENGVLVAGPKVRDFEIAIENLLGSQEIFLASIFSSQNNAGDLCNAKPSERKTIFAKMLGLEKMQKLSDLAKKSGEIIELKLSEKENLIFQYEDKVKGIEEEQGKLEIMNDRKEKLKGEMNENNKELEKIQAEITQILIKKEKIKDLDNNISKLKDEISETSKTLESDRETYKELSELSESIDQLKIRLSKYREDLKIKESLQTILTEEEKREHEKNILKTKKLSLTKTIDSLFKQVQTIQKIPNQEICKTCPLVSSAYEAEKEIANISNEINELDITLESLGDILGNNIPVITEDIKRKTEEISKNRNVDEEYTKALTAQAKMETIKETGLIRSKQLTLKEKELSGLIIIRSGVEEFDESIIEKEKELKHEGHEKTNIYSNLLIEKGQTEQRITIIHETIEQLKQLKIECETDKQQFEDYKLICQAFGKQGIQPILIDEATPEMEDIADDLLNKATDGRMRIRFETQKKLKSNEISESFDIIISKDGHDRDIAEFSGGEQKLLRTIIRLTISAWQARKSEKRLKTLFVDEAFENLDSENSQRIIKIFYSLQEYFERIFIVSHDDNMITEIPARIDLEKKSGETTVSKYK